MFEFGKGYINVFRRGENQSDFVILCFFSKIMVLKFYVFELNMKT
jgi:hypothetical protein